MDDSIRIDGWKGELVTKSKIAVAAVAENFSIAFTGEESRSAYLL